jgi:hypothetical protein
MLRKLDSCQQAQANVEHGVRNRPNRVTPIMPAKTVMPVAERTSAPAPCERTRGMVPAMKATEVITIGRRHRRQASSAASTTPLP